MMKHGSLILMCMVLAAMLHVAELPTGRTAQAAEAVPEAGQSAAPPAIHTFAELLRLAERIVIAEVGPAKDGLTQLTVRETLRAPETEAKFVEPERLKRAAELLANQDLKAPPLPPKPKPPAALRVRAENFKLPAEGTQAVFVLWEKTEGGGAETAYRLNHPQNIYDLDVVSQLKAGLAAPRAINPESYLRAWDREMAGRLRQRRKNEALLSMKGGEVSGGMRVLALRPALHSRGDNSFSVTVKLENQRERPLAVYAGPAGGFGVVLKPKDGAGMGYVLHAANTTGADLATLGLADEMDFLTVPGNSFTTRELFFDAHDFARLQSFDGAWTISAFYTSTQDGQGLPLDAPVWTGTVLSENLPLTFKARKLVEP